MNNDFEPIQYEDTLHSQFQEKRRQIAERINTAIAQNQDCYIAYWVKQNPDKNLDDYTLVHGFKGGVLYILATTVAVIIMKRQSSSALMILHFNLLEHSFL